MNRTPAILLLLVFTGIGVYLVSRALAGGGPLLFFLSAVAFGMAIGVVQGLMRGGRR